MRGHQVSLSPYIPPTDLTRRSLAWAELYIMLAALVTRLKLRVYETTREDVDIYSDMLIAEPKRYMNGVRFQVV